MAEWLLGGFITFNTNDSAKTDYYEWVHSDTKVQWNSNDIGEIWKK